MSAASAGRAPRWSLLALFAIIAFNVWLRAHTFGPTVRDFIGVSLWPVTGAESEPLDCDEAAYGYIGKQIASGKVLYRDVTENKPPLGYWLYALAVAIGGENELAIRLMPMPMIAATIVLLWWVALRVCGAVAACLAALIYSVASTDPYLFGNGSNMEHAMNLFSVASLALMVRAMECEAPPRWWILAAGACSGAACLVKQVAVTHLALYSIVLLLKRPPAIAGESPRPKPASAGRLFDLLALVLGFAFVWIVALGVLFAQGAGRDAYEDIVRYGGALVTDTPAEPHAPPLLVRWGTGNADPEGRLPWPFGRTDYLVWWGTGTWPLWLATVPATLWLLLGQTTALRRIVAGWTLSAWVQVALPRLFWPHYYLLPLPGVALVLAIAIGDAAASAKSRSRSEPQRRAHTWAARTALCALLLALAWTARIQVRDYLLVAPVDLTIRFKGGRQWVANRALGRELAARTRGWSAPRLFVWGWQSPLLFYSGMEAPSRHFFADPLLQAYAGKAHALIAPRVEEIMATLRAHPPEVVFAGEKPFPALRAFLLEHYRPVQLLPDGRGLWVERNMYARYVSAAPGRRDR